MLDIGEQLPFSPAIADATTCLPSFTGRLDPTEPSTLLCSGYSLTCLPVIANMIGEAAVSEETMSTEEIAFSG